jgi:hypothetical protein
VELQVISADTLRMRIEIEKKRAADTSATPLMHCRMHKQRKEARPMTGGYVWSAIKPWGFMLMPASSRAVGRSALTLHRMTPCPGSVQPRHTSIHAAESCGLVCTIRGLKDKLRLCRTALHMPVDRLALSPQSTKSGSLRIFTILVKTKQLIFTLLAFTFKVIKGK